MKKEKDKIGGQEEKNKDPQGEKKKGGGRRGLGRNGKNEGKW